MCGLHRDEVRRLRQSIDNDPNGIIPCYAPRQSNNKVHRNPRPFPLWHEQWLQHARWSLMLHFHLLTGETYRYINGDIPSQVLPPEAPSQILVHLGGSRMYSVLGMMCLIKQLLPELCALWQNQPALHPQSSVMSYRPINMRLSGYLPLAGLNPRILRLCCNNSRCPR